MTDKDCHDIDCPTHGDGAGDDPYRTACEAPEPAWRDLDSFEVSVSKIERHLGVTMYRGGASPEHYLTTKSKAAMGLRIDQRVRVILQVLE